MNQNQLSMEPVKPFACSLPDCGMTFTNEDHLHVHTKKHDMVLQLGIEQKAAFVADQTPTPTRFIRNCEEVGLFQDLQNVNPFDEGFKRAMEIKHGPHCLETAAPAGADDGLHTPQMVFPLADAGDCALYSTTDNRRLTISRSSSDESGAVKEYETTTISKLTNEVTTISRVVGKQDVMDRVTTTDDVSIVKHEETARNRDGVNETSVSYTNNVIKIHSNVEIRKDGSIVNIDASKKPQKKAYNDSKDNVNKDVGKLEVPDKIPILSQKSIDLIVDSLASECKELDKDSAKSLKRNFSKVASKSDSGTKLDTNKSSNDVGDFEVIIKLPNGRKVRMKGVDEEIPEKTIQKDTKEKLKNTIKSKVNQVKQKTSNVPGLQIPISTGTLIPVTLVNPMQTLLPKIPIVRFTPPTTERNFKTVKRKVDGSNQSDSVDSTVSGDKGDSDKCVVIDGDKVKIYGQRHARLDSHCAASRRYRERLKESTRKQGEENRQLREANRRLVAEKALLTTILADHIKRCPLGDELRIMQEKLQRIQ